jgi:hypothetical protein
MYAFVSVLFFNADSRIVGAGQAHTIHGATTTAQEADKANKLRGAGFVRHWFDNARPSGAPQSYAGVVR